MLNLHCDALPVLLCKVLQLYSLFMLLLVCLFLLLLLRFLLLLYGIVIVCSMVIGVVVPNVSIIGSTVTVLSLSF